LEACGNGKYDYQMYNASGVKVRIDWVIGEEGPYHFDLNAGACSLIIDNNEGGAQIVAVTPD
jgi:hypothetical protein